MRVLHVIPAVASRYGGPSEAVVSMCQALGTAGVETIIATTNADGEHTLEVPLGVLSSWQGVPTIFFNRDFSESLKYSAALARWVRRHATDFDVVHIHAVLSHTSLAAAAACHAQGVPYVLRPLGTLSPWSLSQNALRKQLMLRLKAGRLIGDAAVVHCTSDQELADVHRLSPQARGAVVPLGIDQSLLADSPAEISERSRDSYVLAMSRLHPKKNLESLIRAFAAVVDRPSAAAWRLVIAGAGDDRYEASLQQLVRTCGVSDRVSFAGWIAGDERRKLVRHASLFALASLHENFGISVLEALGAGVPVVVSRNVDLAPAVESAGAGWLVGTDVASIADGLTQAFADASERDRRSQAAHVMAHAYAWPKVARQIAAMYDRVTTSVPERRRHFHWVSSVSGERSQLHRLDDAMGRYYREQETRLRYQDMLDGEAVVQPATEQALRKAILSRRPESILEVGCGGGRLYRALRGDGFTGHYTGIEMSAEVIARNRLECPDATWMQESILGSTRLHNRFDVVFAYFVLEHLVYPARALEQMVARLRPGGAVILVFPDFVAMGRFASQSLGFVEGRAGELLKKGRPVSALFNLYESRVRLPRALRRAVERHGPFPINLSPRCLHTPGHVEPDVDAVYIASKEEVRAWAEARDLRVGFPAGTEGNFRDNVLIELALSDKAAVTAA